ncbi:hypothetical protein P280DRAFT_411393 [Massarina eburnea CBS 473.64]|uniref:CFEM domain-containing protein n=1 Tax=Massarina eburnea CBS 473.64 TaxID=1395130 RepID=A0A6A6RK16_9PLEO|nr:hypothetical protein P280DRAFT_411393 [Massarina eburnea CBS 473.64]
MVLRAVIGAILCLLAFTNFAVSALADGPQNLTLADVPACGLSCLIENVASSGCAVADTQCQCKSEDYARTASACILAKCTMEEMIQTAKVQSDLCNLSDESKTREVFLYTVIGYGIGLLFVGLRLWGKLVTKRLAIDDLICLAALLLTALPVGCVLKMQSIGFGDHLWNLDNGRQLLEILRFFWISATTYILILGGIKVSLVLLYVEIFPDKRTRMAAYIILAIIVANSFGIYLSSIFICTPIRGYWDLDLHAKCTNMNAIGYAVSGSSIGQDLILLIFPLVRIRTLNMKRKRKIAVGFMFCMGTFGCITTFLRLHSLLKFKTTIDPTWDYVPVTNWTTLELLSGFVCISLPSVRMLAIHYLPKGVVSSLSSSSKDTPTPRQDQGEMRKRERKGFSWMHITTDRFDSNISASRHTTMWPGSTHSPRLSRSASKSMLKSRSRSRSHQRLNSALSDYDEINLSHVRTATPQVPDSRVTSAITSAENREPVAATQSRNGHMCSSCGSQMEYITALPIVGCLPDESFDEDDEDWRSRQRGSYWVV